MDNWAWVNELSDKLGEQGHGRLASLIHEIPNHHYDGREDMVDALIPEALAATRGLNIPWLEVYFKHWHSSSRIGQHQGEVLLGEVVNAYELAHQEKNQRCPQSVCTTQDLVAVYGNVDGPGWSQERIAACDETLARIDPSWACFNCISIERANAMGDSGPEQAREAVVYLQKQTAASHAAGEEPCTVFVCTTVEQWLVAGDAHRALQVLDETESETDKNDEREERSRRLLRCRALALTGRAREAHELLPAFEDLPKLSWVSWCRAIAAICLAETELNEPGVGQAIGSTLELLHQGGSHRILIDLALLQATLANARQIPWMAQAALTLAEQHRTQLRQDFGAAQKLTQARTAHAAVTAPALPCPAEELMTWLQVAENTEHTPRETVIQWLFTARRQLPDDESLTSHLAYLLAAHGYADVGREQLQAMVLAAPQSAALQNHWFELCNKLGDVKGMEDQARRIDNAQPALAAWFRAKLAFQQARYEQVGPLVQQLLSHDPQALSTKRLWADAAMKMKDFDIAVQLRRELQALEAEPGNRAWDMLIAASAARNWAEVRLQAQALEMNLDAPEDDQDPVVEENWGFIRLRYSADRLDLLARRTGPATARIIQPPPHLLDQHMGDWVVFEPAPLEQPPEDEEERKHYTYVYAQPFHVLQTGAYLPTYFLDGVHPGPRQLDDLRNALDEEGWTTWLYSGSGYRLLDANANPAVADADLNTEDEHTVPGIFIAVAAPDSVKVEYLEARIRDLCEGMQLCWPELAKAAGQPSGRHDAIRQRYNL